MCGVCVGVCGCVRVCASVGKCTRVCIRVCGYGRECRVWAGVHIVWDEFSEFLLENRVSKSADFNTNFFTMIREYDL